MAVLLNDHGGEIGNKIQTIISVTLTIKDLGRGYIGFFPENKEEGKLMIHYTNIPDVILVLQKLINSNGEKE